MDRKNIEMLKILNKNARTPVSVIARAIGLTENAVKYRIERLEKGGYIKGYRPSLSSKKFGKNLNVVFLINVKPDSVVESMKILAKYRELTKVYRCAGQYSIVCVGFFSDDEHLQEFLDKKLLVEIPVTDWMEHIILKRHKNDEFNVEMVF